MSGGKLALGKRVYTKDGYGTIIGYSNSVLGYRVKLDNGRITIYREDEVEAVDE